MKINKKLMGFAAGTKVLMADGSERAIENIKTGDLVLSFDQLDAFGALEPKRVLNTFKRIDRNPLKVKVVGSEVELTVAPGQLFINPGSDWKDAVNINEIIDGDGNVHKFDVSQITRGKHQMYDIIVEDNHSLIANGVRVHNMTYSIADVIAGRNLAGSDIQSGSISNYYRTGDYDNNNDMYQEGRNKKKKSRRRKTSKPEPKIDGLQAGAKLLSSIEDLVELLGEIVDNTAPANLTVLKVVVQQSVDNIVNYLASFGAAILNATMNAYDKSEILIMTADMTQAAIAMRKPFEETVVSASGKLLAQTQLKLFDLQIARMNGILETYLGPAEEDRDLFDVERNNNRTRGSKSRRNANTRGSDGRYNEGGGSRGGGNTQAGNRSGGNNRSGGKTTGGGPAPAKNTKTGGPGAKPRADNKAPARSSGSDPTNRPDGQRQGANSRGSDPTNTASGQRAGANNNRSSGASAASERAAGDRAAKSNAASQAKTNQGNAARNANSASKSTSTGSKSGGGCFAYGTLFKMADGSLKAIQDIRIGDVMLNGGRVEIVLQGDGYTQDWYSYNNILVTGSHPVLDIDGVWRRVEETAIAIPVDANDTFYSLYNENQRMIANNNTVFTDFLEVGMQHPLRRKVYGMEAHELIDILNGKLGADV